MVSITFDLEGVDENVEVFTTRPDTLMGVTYIVLAPEHPLTSQIATPERREVCLRCWASLVIVMLLKFHVCCDSPSGARDTLIVVMPYFFCYFFIVTFSIPPLPRDMSVVSKNQPIPPRCAPCICCRGLNHDWQYSRTGWTLVNQTQSKTLFLATRVLTLFLRWKSDTCTLEGKKNNASDSNLMV